MLGYISRKNADKYDHVKNLKEQIEWNNPHIRIEFFTGATEKKSDDQRQKKKKDGRAKMNEHVFYVPSLCKF